MEEINPVTRVEFDNHTHNKLNTLRIDPVDLLVFTKQVTDATTAPTDAPLNGTVRVLFDGVNYVEWVRVNKLWKILSLQTINTPPQYSEAKDFTGSGTYTITTGFTPKEVSLNGYLFYSGSPNIYATSVGQAGIVSPTTGKCNYYGITAGSLAITIATNNYLGGFSTCYCYVSSWISTGMVITYVCPTNWTLGTNLIITG